MARPLQRTATPSSVKTPAPKPHHSTGLTLAIPVPDGETIVRMRKRINELINADLRFTFGQ